MNENAANNLYNQRKERIRKQLASIEALLERHDRTTGLEKRWDHAGDLGRIKENLDLVEILFRRYI